MNERRSGFDRPARIEDGGKLLVLDAQETAGGPRRVERVGGHGGDGLALIADDVARQDSLVAQVEAQANVEVLAGEHGAHSGHRAGRRRVDANDARRSMGRGEDRRVQHAGEREIGRVARRAGHLVDRVLTRDGGSDDAKLTVTPTSTPVGSELRSGSL